MKTARPYRSHKYPACTRCHKRRSRCTIEVPGQACLLCRMHGVPCSSATAKKDERVTPKVGFIHRSMIPENEGMDESSYIVGPIVARDTQIMDQYLPNASNGQNGHVPIQPNFMRGDSQKAIYRAPLPPRRPSPQDCNCSRNMPTELLEQVDPFLDKLVSAFYENVHPAFPITEEHCVVIRLKDRSQLPQTFLINMVAYSLFYWDSITKPCDVRKAKPRFCMAGGGLCEYHGHTEERPSEHLVGAHEHCGSSVDMSCEQHD